MVRVLAVADEEVPAMRSRVHGLRVDLVLAAGDLPWHYLESLTALIDAPAARAMSSRWLSSSRFQ